MHDQSQASGDRRLERAIILQLLSAEHGRACSQAELASTLSVDAAVLRQALDRLAQAEVVELDDTHVRASPAPLRLDQLGLIGI